MGQLVLWMQQTLDGYTEGPNGEFDWPIVEDEMHSYFNDKIRSTAGAFLYGRTTFEMMADFWPTAVDAEHDNTRHFARMWVPMPKVVFSTTLETAEWNSRIVCGDLVGEIDALKVEFEDDLIFIGGATMARTLVRLGVVDEYHLFTHPVLLGGGARLFPELEARINLNLVETTVYGGGVILHRYMPL